MIAIARAAYEDEYNSWTITRIPKLTMDNHMAPALYCVSRTRYADPTKTDSENCPVIDYSEFTNNKDATEFIKDQAWGHALRTIMPLMQENRSIG